MRPLSRHNVGTEGFSGWTYQNLALIEAFSHQLLSIYSFLEVWHAPISQRKPAGGKIKIWKKESGLPSRARIAGIFNKVTIRA